MSIEGTDLQKQRYVTIEAFAAEMERVALETLLKRAEQAKRDEAR